MTLYINPAHEANISLLNSKIKLFGKPMIKSGLTQIFTVISDGILTFQLKILAQHHMIIIGYAKDSL
jgi:hypothetical protein